MSRQTKKERFRETAYKVSKVSDVRPIAVTYRPIIK